MILIISTCKEKMHEREFVKPVERFFHNNFTKHYKDVSSEDLKLADKIVICGTSLKDDVYLNNLNKFDWLDSFEGPVLGICSGMQIIGLHFGGKLKKKQEIGYYPEIFNKKFLGMEGEVQVYHLHNNCVVFPEDFELYSSSGNVAQAVKYKGRPIYCVLFHPEVRNRIILREFEKI